MLPGKKFTPEDVLQIAWKRVWFILLPLAVVSAATAVYVRSLPNMYRSESTIMVRPQRVPEAYVQSTVTTRIEDRLQAIQQTILSRTRLERIINEFNLYAKERESGAIMQDIVERMATRDIRSQILRGDAFRISFTGENPRTTMQVTERLASLFINENLEDRSRMAQNTDQFLEAHVEDTKRRLIEAERKVEEYKRQNAGQLPSQLESNLQVLQNAQMQLQQVAQALVAGRERQVRLERDIADLEQQIEDGVAAPIAPGVEPSTPTQQLEQLRNQLDALLLTKRETYPDVRRLRAAIAELEQKVASKPETADADAPVSPDLRRLSPSEIARRKRLDDMKLDLDSLTRNIASGEAEEARLRNQIVVYQRRNEAIPARETEMTEMLRDYSMLSKLYLDNLAKLESAKMATSLESRQIGEQFTVLEPARIPERPFSPDRQRLNAMGVAAGLGLGLLLVAFLEYRDRSFKTDEEIAQVLALPVLAVVPLMESAAEKRWAFRKRLLMGFGFGTTVLACLAVVAYTIVR
jgi:polysaccharide chain length determinant protein (PEP-CTERM system associated)